MTPALGSERAPDDVLRTLAHEIRQPLSAIESIAYYLSLVLPQNVRHREQLARIQQLVEQSNWILANSLQLAQTPEQSNASVDLEEIITHTIAGRPQGLEAPIRLALAGDLPAARLDPSIARSLVQNILMLFRQIATNQHRATLATRAIDGAIEITVACGVPGHRNVATLPPGTALSLDCARRIAEMHGGECELSVDAASGIHLRVMLR